MDQKLFSHRLLLVFLLYLLFSSQFYSSVSHMFSNFSLIDQFWFYHDSEYKDYWNLIRELLGFPIISEDHGLNQQKKNNNIRVPQPKISISSILERKQLGRRCLLWRKKDDRRRRRRRRSLISLWLYRGDNIGDCRFWECGDAGKL